VDSAVEMKEPLSKNRIKWLQSLTKKKVRDEEGLFFAEGVKLVDDLLPAFDCHSIYATEDYFSSRGKVAALEGGYVVTKEELKRISAQCAPQSVFAVFKKRDAGFNPVVLDGKLSLALDTVQDPGNLGTIIRIADWFGIEHVLCSKETVEVYNPKVVQATMGALARVSVHYVDLVEVLKETSLPVYGTFLEGEDIYGEALSAEGVIVMGNEGNGVSEEVKKLVSRKLYIPNFPKGRETSESLNVAVATAITCAEFRRRTY
jgi:TrmH family RNA methyltransferase